MTTENHEPDAPEPTPEPVPSVTRDHVAGLTPPTAVGDDPARATAEAEKANAEVQAKADAANAKGYIGSVPDPVPNREYSLLSGPDAPPLATDDRTRFDQPAALPEED